MELLLLVATLPVIVLLIYVYRRDVDKEPRHLLIKAFLLGCATIIPAIALEAAAGVLFPIEEQRTLGMFFLAVLVGVALIEEGLKWIVTHRVCYHSGELDHAYDAIVFAVFASLGFALVENIMYVAMYGLSTGLLRTFTAIPCHTCTGVLMGWLLGQAKAVGLRGDKAMESLGLVLSLLVPVLAHGIYDFLLMAAESFGLSSFELIFLVYVIVFFAGGFIIVHKVSALPTNYDGTAATTPRELR